MFGKTADEWRRRGGFSCGGAGVCLLVGLVLWTMQPDAHAVAEDEPAARRFAVLVGVRDYDHPTLNEPKPLQFTEADATELGEVLSGAGYTVTLLTHVEGKQRADRKPTRKNIEDQLRRVLSVAEKRDSVIVAFAGHGVQFIGQPDSFFCPQDAKPFSDQTSTLISLKLVYKLLEESNAGVRMLFVDACRNDPKTARSAGIDADNAPRPPRGVAVLFSCSSQEQSFEHASLKHGVFTHHLLQGLKGQARDSDGDVTFDVLASYVRKQTAIMVPKLIQGGAQQSPNLIADLKGIPPVLLKASDLEKIGIKPVPVPKPISKERNDNELKMKFVRVEAGTFVQGSPILELGRDEDEKQTSGTIPAPFWIGMYEVTQREYKALAGASPWEKSGDDLPATHVSWDEAVAFCTRLTERERQAGRLPRGGEYRLPTETEWEYACRAGTKTPFFCGDKLELEHGLHVAKSAPDLLDLIAGSGPQGVGKTKANAWGLFDTHGNVWEWCLPGKPSDTLVPMRGGSFDSPSKACRSASRSEYARNKGSKTIGFRIVRTGADE